MAWSGKILSNLSNDSFVYAVHAFQLLEGKSSTVGGHWNGLRSQNATPASFNPPSAVSPSAYTPLVGETRRQPRRSVDRAPAPRAPHNRDNNMTDDLEQTFS